MKNNQNNKVTIIDLSDTPAEIEVGSGSLNGSSYNVHVKVSVRRISDEYYEQIDKIKRKTLSVNISKQVKEEFQIITSHSSIKVIGNLSQAEYRSDVSPGLSEYFFKIHGDSVEFIAGKHAIRKYLIDEALKES